MADARTLVEKMLDMAHADESPHERDFARRWLDDRGVGWREPPRRPPTAPAADGFEWFRSFMQGNVGSTAHTSTTTSWTLGEGVFVRIRVG